MGASGTIDPARQTRWASARDQYARSDQRHPLSSSHRLPMALSSSRGISARSTVYNIFRNFQKAGTWDAIWERLHMDLREVMGREASASAAIIDSQSLKSVEKGAVMTV